MYTANGETYIDTHPRVKQPHECRSQSPESIPVVFQLIICRLTLGGHRPLKRVTSQRNPDSDPALTSHKNLMVKLLSGCKKLSPLKTPKIFSHGWSRILSSLLITLIYSIMDLKDMWLARRVARRKSQDLQLDDTKYDATSYCAKPWAGLNIYPSYSHAPKLAV